MTHAADRTIRIDGLFNMRDVGGLRTGDATVKHGKLLRSDGLHHLTDAGRAQFSELGISTVFDLRDDKERSMAPSKTDGLAVTTVASPIFQGSEQLLTNPNITLDEFYRGMVDGYSENYASTLRAIAQTEDDTVLIHCTAGKDRTGTVAALALTVAGVERDDVLHDYSLTEDNLAGPWLDKHLSMVEAMGIPVTPALRVIIGGSPPEAIDSTLRHLEQRFGSIEDYLRSGGMSDAELELLAAVLVD